MSEPTPTRYVAIDVETPNHKNNRISSIGYAVFDNHDVSPSAIRINVLGFIPSGIPLEAVELGW